MSDRFLVRTLAVLLWLVAPMGAFAANGMALLASLAGAFALVQVVRVGGVRLLVRAPGLLPIAALIGLIVASAQWAIVPTAPLQLLPGLLPPLLAGPLIAAGVATLDSAGRQRLALALQGAFWLLFALTAANAATDGAVVSHVRALFGKTTEAFVWPSLSRPLVILSLLIWPVAGCLWRDGRRWQSLAAIIAVCILVFAGRTLSAWLAFAVGGVVFLALAWTGRVGRMALALTLTVLFVSMPIVISTVARPEQHYDALRSRSTSALHRMYIWEFTVARIDEAPLLGFGADSARAMPGGETPTPVGGYVMNMHPHNGSLQVRLELGIAGVMVVAVLLAWVGLALVRHGTAFDGAMFTVAFIIANLSFGIWQSWWVGVLALLPFCALLARPRLEQPAH